MPNDQRTARFAHTARFLAFLLSCAPMISVAETPDGAAIYHQYCSVCHGDQGDGRSRARGSMIPPPRDFTTPSASVELTRERMLDGVVQGRPGTAMAAWGSQLRENEIEAVVDYVRNVLMRPVASELAEEPRRLYAENCSVCHGDDGSGAKWTLRNMNPPPRNFTDREAVRGLGREDMVQTVRYGRANTAMPGFERQLSPEQIASIVDYVRKAFMRVPSTPHGPAAAAAGTSDTSGGGGYPGGLVPNLASGLAFYMQNCLVCHGANGDGKGPRAYFILPKPRDFQHPASRHGLDRPRLFQAIAKGTRGSEMPAWEKVLTGQEIADVAEYVYQTFIRQGESNGSVLGR